MTEQDDEAIGNQKRASWRSKCRATLSKHIYDVQLRIGNGGAGQSGLIKALANAFIKSSVRNGSDPLAVEWYNMIPSRASTTCKDGTIDIGITYTPAAESIAIMKGFAKGPA
ncbi:hypothetical protein N7532_008277 [Penicillium argentinense]|uniref:PBP domain-containing protein n=1 Tax=Penicillium argentinense TaxID=1131581 RepID=A0A9W9K1G7_9EURO|nr:uncharacterized protein N7532_008277 [Penicillium argentinense]KAJ5089593.1 hypothetical protein N7532_008277 [Penicillium argentinense]